MILLRAGGLPTTGQISGFEIAFACSLSEILILRFFKIKIVTFDFIYCDFVDKKYLDVKIREMVIKNSFIYMYQICLILNLFNF